MDPLQMKGPGDCLYLFSLLSSVTLKQPLVILLSMIKLDSEMNILPALHSFQ